MRCRRDYRDLTPAEKTRFIAALHHVKSRGVVDAFADLHEVHFSHGHRNSSFLPWHREFIRRFEAELQTYDPRVMLCYWNSSEDQSTTSPLWDPSFLGPFGSAWNLGRTLGSTGALPTPTRVTAALNQTSYPGFRPDLESNVHDVVHIWVGGAMSGARSPLDPVFYLHHCYIDMLWAQWQLRHPGAPFVPDAGGPGLPDAMDPWPTTVGDVIDHRVINAYAYPAGSIEDASHVSPPPSSPPSITFPAVPAGYTYVRSALFQVDSCERLTFTIDEPAVDSGPSGTAFRRLDASIVVDPHVEPTGRVWISYRGTSPGDHATGHVQVACVETGDTWAVPLTADVVAPPSAAVALLLDQSNSMNFDSGIAPGVPRSEVLRFSAPPCVDVLDDNHAVTVISFDHDPHLLRPLTRADATGRIQLSAAINSYAPNPDGWTAIGEALSFAQGRLAPVSGYDFKATVVLTDGQENHGPYNRLSVTDVASLIDQRVYAIGLGTPANLSPAALQALCNGHQGYMLITGDLNPDAYFRLAKYYQQILSGVTNQDIVLDPEGVLHPGEVVRIPFRLTEADITARAVLLTDHPRAVLYGLETPEGHIIEPTVTDPMVEFRAGDSVEMYRVSLPLPIEDEQAHAGQWQALMAFDRSDVTRALRGRRSSARYSLGVHVSSNLRMRAALAQSGNEPGAAVHLRASLTEYALPLSSPARVYAEVVHPDEARSQTVFTPVGDGVYEATFPATQAGVYRCRIIADGTTGRGTPFSREQTLTAAVWAGGDREPPAPDDPGARTCRLLHCLLQQPTLRKFLQNNNIDPQEIMRCLDEFCGRAEPVGDPLAVVRSLVNDEAVLAVIAEALGRAAGCAEE
ncbi:tyrosinase family protein [Streptomyces sp. NPDC005336]|uniref:tyrosinase family protein n=1 Tax=Streptomyces sp. NPDC005336 TaxID=3157035 RepID=UPI00339FA1CA